MRCSPTQTKFTATVAPVTNTRRPTCLPFETMQNGDNNLKDSEYSCTVASCCPKLAIQLIQITLKHELQFRVSHNDHIRHRSSCLICTLPTSDNDMGGRRRLVIEGYGWSGYTSVDRHLDSPHAAASLVYSPPPPHSTAAQGLKKFSMKQLHQVATTAFGYTVHDGSLPADSH